MLVVLALASSANIHLADSEADIALRVGQRNIKSFQEQTQLMIDAWQDACKIDKACTTADQTILAKVYSYYADTVRCRGNVAFNTVAPPTIAHMMTEGYDVSRAGYDLPEAIAKECFAHDTTVMAAGDLDYGIQDVEEEFAIVPGTGGKAIYTAATFSMGWKGAPLRDVTSIYRYEFDDDGKIVEWKAHYDPIFVYDLLGGRDGKAACLTSESRPQQQHSSMASVFAAGAIVGGMVASFVTLKLASPRVLDAAEAMI